MADNVTANPGSGGATFATDEIGPAHWPRMKLTLGADGVNDGDVSASNPMPVTVGNFPATQAVSAASLPLPSGAATEATLAALNAKVPPAGQALMAASQPVVIASNQTAIPTVENATVFTGAAAQTAVVNNIIEDPSGASATAAENFRSASVQVVSTGTGGTFIFEQSNDGTNFVALPVFNAALVTGVPITAAITATASSIIYTFPVRARFIRLRIATLITGGSIRAFSRFSTEPWTAAAQLVASNTAANMNVTVGGALPAIVGQAAHDAVIAGNPVRLAGRALTANYTAVATGDVADLVTTLVGALIQKPYAIPESDWSYAAATGGIINTTDVPVRAAGAAGIRNYVTAASFSNNSATATEVVIKDGATTVLWRGMLPANAPNFPVAFPTPLRGTPATAVNVACITTGAAVYANVQGYIGP